MPERRFGAHPAVTAARSVAARLPIGRYEESARVADAPHRFSAESLVAWSFGRCGIALEDDLLALYASGEPIVGSDLWSGDLIFRTGRRDRYPGGRPRYGVGHVGICSGEGTVVHASPRRGLVHEDLLEAFLDEERVVFRGVRRIARP
jgi:hypothetical protein